MIPKYLIAEPASKTVSICCAKWFPYLRNRFIPFCAIGFMKFRLILSQFAQSEYGQNYNRQDRKLFRCGRRSKARTSLLPELFIVALEEIIRNFKKKFIGLINFAHDSRWKKLPWGGYISRVKDERWGYKILHWALENKRGKCKLKARWGDDLEKFSKSKLFYRLALGKAKWNRLRESFAQELGLAYWC